MRGEARIVAGLLSATVAWPTCALGAWSAAWLTGRCSPDDVIEALAESADRHLLHWPDGGVAGAEQNSPATGSANGVLDLLALLRERGRRALAAAQARVAW